MPWDFALILLVLATVVPWLGRRRVRQIILLPDTTSIERLLLYASTIAFQWIAVGVFLWRSLARNLKSGELGLALPHPTETIAIGVGLSCVLFANQLLSVRRLASHPAEAQQPLVNIALRISPRNSVERLAFFALVATVGVCEEVIYRGFSQTVLQHWLGGFLV